MTFARRISSTARRLHARQELRRELGALSAAEADDLLTMTNPDTDGELRRMLFQARSRRELPFWAA
jgi:hypothetical protein